MLNNAIEQQDLAVPWSKYSVQKAESGRSLHFMKNIEFQCHGQNFFK